MNFQPNFQSNQIFLSSWKHHLATNEIQNKREPINCSTLNYKENSEGSEAWKYATIHRQPGNHRTDTKGQRTARQSSCSRTKIMTALL